MPRPAFLGKKHTFVCDVCGQWGDGNVSKDKRVVCWRCVNQRVTTYSNSPAIDSIPPKSHQNRSGRANVVRNAGNV